MRRAAAALAGTVLAMWLVLSFKSSPAPLTTSLAGGAGPGTTALRTVAGAGDTSEPAAGTGDTSEPAAGEPPGPSGPGTTRPSSGPGTTTPSSGPAQAQPAPSGPRTVVGNVEPNRYGNVQVAVVLNGTRIIDVKTLQMPSDRARSADISRQAAPLLHDEVIQAQNAQIDTIGGATYTSDGYARSLQSALDQARA